MKKLTLPLIFGLVLILNRNASSQGIYAFPDSLFQAGDYKNAEIAYKKKIFDLSNTSSDLTEAYYLKLSNLYFVQRNYEKAYNCLKKITNDSLIAKEDLAYKRAFCTYLASDFASCEYEIILERLKTKLPIDPRLAMLEVLSLNEQESWTKAYEICKTDLYKNWKDDSARIKECDRFYSKLPKMKSARKAEVLNFIIPGAGFFYLGKNKEGLISSTMQLASLGLAGVFVWQKLYLSGFFIGLGLYGKFKTGSTRQVLVMTKEVNAKKRFGYNNKLRSMLLN